MRLLIAMMKHETNSFSPIPTPWQRFVDWDAFQGADVVKAYRGTAMPIGSYIDLAEAERLALGFSREALRPDRPNRP